jgi:hypothetical protein
MRFRKTRLLVASLLAMVFAAVAQKPAQGVADPAVQAFASRFQAAMRADDKEKLAAMIAFPVEFWTVDANNTSEVSIKDRSDFLARYSTLVTPRMRKNIAQAKLSGSSTGNYLSWHDKDSEYTFDIERRDGEYRVTSYSVGAY